MDTSYPCSKTAVFAVYPSSSIGGSGGVDFFGGFKIGGITRRLSRTNLALFHFSLSFSRTQLARDQWACVEVSPLSLW
jgi:hypothetical protein